MVRNVVGGLYRGRGVGIEDVGVLLLRALRHDKVRNGGDGEDVLRAWFLLS
jgi:hypothetical protein